MKKDEIIAYFKTKYPALNLRTKRLDVLAARLESKIKDESELSAKLDELNEIMPFTDIAKEDDALHESERKLKEFGHKKASETPEKNVTPAEGKKDETPEWAKNLINEVQGLKAEKVTNARKSNYEATVLKGIDEVVKARALKNFDRLTKDLTDEDYQAWESEEAAFYKTQSEQQSVDQMGGLPPMNGTGASGKVSDKELDAIMDGLRF